MEFIDNHKKEFGVEPICRELQVAPSTYYAVKSRPPSRRAVGDAVLSEVIAAEHTANYGVYGARKMWRHLNRLGHPVARCTVERLMRGAGLHGVVRGRAKRSRGPWRTLDDVEIATLEWVDWFNNHRLHTELGHAPPAEHEANHYRQITASTTRETREPSLH